MLSVNSGHGLVSGLYRGRPSGKSPRQAPAGNPRTKGNENGSLSSRDARGNPGSKG